MGREARRNGSAALARECGYRKPKRITLGARARRRANKSPITLMSRLVLMATPRGRRVLKGLGKLALMGDMS